MGCADTKDTSDMNAKLAPISAADMASPPVTAAETSTPTVGLTSSSGSRVICVPDRVNQNMPFIITVCRNALFGSFHSTFHAEKASLKLPSTPASTGVGT